MFGAKKSKPGPAPSGGFFYLPRLTRKDGIFVSDQQGEYLFTAFLKVLANETGSELQPNVLKHPDNAVNSYIRNFDLVLVMKDHEGRVICYSSSYTNRLPRAFTDQLRSHFNIGPDSDILWADDVFTEPQYASAREVLYGQKLEKPPTRRTREQIRRTWAHPQALSPKEMDYLLGRDEEP